MKKNQKNEKEQLANLLIAKAKNKYAKYVGYLNDDFYKEVYKRLLNLDNISIDSYFFIDNLVIKRLTDFVNDGDIELEIYLIEEYFPKTRFILNKKNLDTRLAETVLMKSIETYQGDKIFSLHILDCVKEIIDVQKQEATETQEKQLNDLKKHQKNFSTIIQQYVEEHHIEKRKPTYLESSFKILSSFMPLDDENLIFNQFIYLKYGYYHDIYFSQQDITTILNINNEEVSNYYKESLILQKNTLNQVISHMMNIQYVKK